MVEIERGVDKGERDKKHDKEVLQEEENVSKANTRRGKEGREGRSGIYKGEKGKKACVRGDE